jgi:hypothetical protein
MRASILVAVLLAFLPATTAAQFPTTMNYQVMLTDDFDQPLVDQPVELVFRLYDAPSGGVAGWTETHNTTTNSIGVVSVILGSTDPLDFGDFPGMLYLEVEVDGEILSPRRQLTAAPYAFDSYGAHQLAGLPASDYATDDELSTPGTINQPGNPVDWTRLKNVPAGFADGDDAAGGVGDGYSLDADDGDPVDALYVNEDGHVGIGVTNVVRTLHVHAAGSNPATFGLSDGTTGSTSGDGICLTLQPEGNGFLTNNEDGRLSLRTAGTTVIDLQPHGILEVGGFPGESGELHIVRTGVSDPEVKCLTDADGGHVEVYDEAGNMAAVLEADNSGTGGHLQVARDASYGTEKGIDLNGNWAGLEEPAVRIMGSSRSASFYMSNTGNGSVQLPADAIYDNEILDEPGVAGDVVSGSVGLDTGYTVITSKSIDIPAAGYVLAMAGCTIRANHTTTSDADIGVSNSASSLPPSQTITFTLPSTVPDGTYYFPGSYDGLFEAGSAGVHTYYFVGREYAGDLAIFDAHLTLVYLPTAYGTVDPPLLREGGRARENEGQPGRGLTAAQIATERAEAEAFRLARIERELAEIQAQVEAMKEETTGR